jgi:hypothetical protein
VPGARAVPRSHVSLAAFIAVCALVLALGLNAAYTTWAVNASQHRWCAVIDLLNAAPPPAGVPQKNPARAYDHDLKGSLGCGS